MTGASGALVKYHYLDHDSYIVSEVPPDVNVWYELFDEEDVRLIWNTIYQKNDEAAAKDLEVRWTCDGNVYTLGVSVANNTYRYVYREFRPAASAFALTSAAVQLNAAFGVDKRAQAFKIEVRFVDVLGTNQQLRSYGVLETLEPT